MKFKNIVDGYFILAEKYNKLLEKYKLLVDRYKLLVDRYSRQVKLLERKCKENHKLIKKIEKLKKAKRHEPLVEGGRMKDIDTSRYTITESGNVIRSVCEGK